MAYDYLKLYEVGPTRTVHVEGCSANHQTPCADPIPVDEDTKQFIMSNQFVHLDALPGNAWLILQRDESGDVRLYVVDKNTLNRVDPHGTFDNDRHPDNGNRDTLKSGIDVVADAVGPHLSPDAVLAGSDGGAALALLTTAYPWLPADRGQALLLAWANFNKSGTVASLLPGFSADQVAEVYTRIKGFIATQLNAASAGQPFDQDTEARGRATANTVATFLGLPLPFPENPPGFLTVNADGGGAFIGKLGNTAQWITNPAIWQNYQPPASNNAGAGGAPSGDVAALQQQILTAHAAATAADAKATAACDTQFGFQLAQNANDPKVLTAYLTCLQSVVQPAGGSGGTTLGPNTALGVSAATVSFLQSAVDLAQANGVTLSGFTAADARATTLLEELQLFHNDYGVWPDMSEVLANIQTSIANPTAAANGTLKLVPFTQPSAGSSAGGDGVWTPLNPPILFVVSNAIQGYDLLVKASAIQPPPA